VKLAGGRPPDGRLAHIVEDGNCSLDSNQLGTSRGTTLEGNGRLAAAEVAGNECEQFFVRLAIDWRRLKLSYPSAALGSLEDADASIRFDPYRDHRGLHFRNSHMGPNVQVERRAARVRTNEESSIGPIRLNAGLGRDRHTSEAAAICTIAVRREHRRCCHPS